MAADVKPGDREHHSATHDGRFPINSRAEARSALRLRGQHTTKAQRLSIINRAAKFLPAAAKRARDADRKAGKI